MIPTNSERIGFSLDRPLLAHLITLKADGFPHVAPVWYEYRDGAFLVWTNKGTRKYKNLILNSKVGLSNATNDEPYEYIAAEGTADVTDEGVEPLAFSIASRYKGPRWRKAVRGGQV
jgi:PPOX class probable F420-dependent enzyme